MIRHPRIRIPVLLSLLCVALLATVPASITHAETIETVIPSDSFIYLKLQNLKACRETIENSEDWQEAATTIAATPNWQPLSQFMQMLPMFTGTDLPSLIETFFGGQVAVTVSAGAEGLIVGLTIENGDKRQAVEETLAKMLNTLRVMSGSQTPTEVGNYEGVTYHTTELDPLRITYGNVGMLLLVGITPGSFEKMVDTYKKSHPAITENPAYQSAVNYFKEDEVLLFVDTAAAQPFIGATLPPPLANQLAAFQTMVCSWDLLRPGGSLQISGTLQADAQGILTPLLQTQPKMRSIQGLSGEEELFFTVAPASSQTLWQLILGGTRTSTDTESAGNFLISVETDVIDAVTGEFAIAGNLSTLEALREHGTNFNTRSVNNKIESIEIEFPEADLGIIFNPDSPSEWQALFSGLLEKLSTEPIRQSNYKGITLNIASIPGILYYGNVNELVVIAFSERRCQSLMDNLLTGETAPNIKKKLDALSAPPTCLFQLNLGKFLSFLADTEEFPWLGQETGISTEKVGNLFTSLAVESDVAQLELTFSSEEMPIDAVARVAPLIFLIGTQGSGSTE